MVEPIRADLYGNEEGLLRETVRRSVELDLDDYPRSEMHIPLDLSKYKHEDQYFSMKVDGAPPKNKDVYKHHGPPFSIERENKRSIRDWLGKPKDFYRSLRGKDVEVPRYLADDVSEALNEIESGSMLFEVQGLNSEGDRKSIGEPVRTRLSNKEECLTRLKLVENASNNNEILTNDLLDKKSSRVLGCSHYAEIRPHNSPYKAWRDMQQTNLEVALYLDVGLDDAVAVGYLGDSFEEDSTFGYRIMDGDEKVLPSHYSKEERTIAVEFEELVERVLETDI